MTKDGITIWQRQNSPRCHYTRCSDGQTGKNMKSNIRFHTNFKIYKSLVASIVAYVCETWTLLFEAGKNIQASEKNARVSSTASPSRHTKPMTMQVVSLADKNLSSATMKRRMMATSHRIITSVRQSCKVLLKA